MAALTNGIARAGAVFDVVLSLCAPIVTAGALSFAAYAAVIRTPSDSLTTKSNYTACVSLATLGVILAFCLATLQRLIVPAFVQARRTKNAMPATKRATTSMLLAIIAAGIAGALTASTLLPPAYSALPVTISLALTVQIFRWQYARPAAFDEIRRSLLRHTRDAAFSLRAVGTEAKPSDLRVAERDATYLLDELRRFSGGGARVLASDGTLDALDIVIRMIPHSGQHLPLDIISLLPRPLAWLGTATPEVRSAAAADFLAGLVDRLEGAVVLSRTSRGRRARSHPDWPGHG